MLTLKSLTLDDRYALYCIIHGIVFLGARHVNLNADCTMCGKM